MNRRVRHILAFLLAAALIGCDQHPAGSLPVTRMQIGTETFDLEIATSSHDQEVGLMHRDHLDSDHGMLFIFPDEAERDFWNSDVHFPLDLIFLDAGGKIVSLKHLDAYSVKNVPSEARAKYTIELNAGTVARLNLKLGDRLTLPKDAINPPGQ
ncbi:MAG TPA: DUF192 domain-containing protein [Tepidisphaeraceae bacterium]|jgi:hypothetical protein|nr:DUF192 domain-containing protein [Tepidisphaeraceae bacterium]